MSLWQPNVPRHCGVPPSSGRGSERKRVRRRAGGQQGRDQTRPLHVQAEELVGKPDNPVKRVRTEIRRSGLEAAASYARRIGEQDMITLKNRFHKTEIRIRKRHGERVARATMNRWRRALCGIDGCNCGEDSVSQRGPALEAVVVEADSRGNSWVVVRPAGLT